MCEYGVRAVAVSGDSRWVVTAGGDHLHGELTAWEVETGIVKTFHGHSREVSCIDISTGDVILASGLSEDHTAQIWSLDTGKLVAGLFETADLVGAIRLPDSKKLAVNSWRADWLRVWDIQTQKLDRRVKRSELGITNAPALQTNKGTRILAAFDFDSSFAKTFYGFDASTLETVGVSFKGHTGAINGLAPSSDGILITSASHQALGLRPPPAACLIPRFQTGRRCLLTTHTPSSSHDTSGMTTISTYATFHTTFWPA
ncbi:hypothetical protein AZE42_08534 [Rhizopogon vesiculosus]|uniref:Uncharacterized protein n=1 Tax=Rhizopogon vesiculosus TaxID=180088 RepID=A0A1J8PND9_9AGAM|nr:hypothetical protein AZE42_08534 [Rhizopogon vesiculosus]